jgi:hypothetical protein
MGEWEVVDIDITEAKGQESCVRGRDAVVGRMFFWRDAEGAETQRDGGPKGNDRYGACVLYGDDVKFMSIEVILELRRGRRLRGGG